MGEIVREREEREREGRRERGSLREEKRESIYYFILFYLLSFISVAHDD